MFEKHRPALRDGVVAEPPLLHLQARRREREVLHVAGLVEERAPVVGTAHRLDHEHHLAGHLDRGAEGARVLGRARLDVEVDVPLRIEVDPEPGERAVQRGQHPVGGEDGVPARAAEQSAGVVALGLVEADPDIGPQSAVHRLLVEALGRVEKVVALGSKAVDVPAEAVAVEREIGGLAELGNSARIRLGRLEVDRVQLAVGQIVAELLERAAGVAVWLVRDRRGQHPVADRAAAVLRFE